MLAQISVHSFPFTGRESTQWEQGVRIGWEPLGDTEDIMMVNEDDDVFLENMEQEHAIPLNPLAPRSLKVGLR